VPVPCSGTVTALHGAVGDIVATGAPLIEFDSGHRGRQHAGTSVEDWSSPAVVGGRAATARPAAARCRRRAALANLGVDLGAFGQRRRRIDHARRCAAARESARRKETRLDGAERRSRIAPEPPEPLRGPRRAMARACRCRAIKVPGSTCATTPTFIAWRARRLHAAADARDDLRLARRARAERLVRPGIASRAFCSGTSISRSPSIRPAD
jgi:pyruvate/2-oxoglutarate dehydrogenase complex dihydrolipoamide acyltransferase (E2) component